MTGKEQVIRHVNIAGTFLWKCFLAIIDSYIKWSEVIQIDK